MSTEPWLAMPPVTTGRNSMAASAPLDGDRAGGDPAAFEQTLMQHRQAGTPADQLPVSAAARPQAPTPPALNAEQLAAFIEQIKLLSGQTAVTSVSDSGNDGDEGGNILPAPGHLADDGSALSADQLEQLAAYLMPIQAPTAPAGEMDTRILDTSPSAQVVTQELAPNSGAADVPVADGGDTGRSLLYVAPTDPATLPAEVPVAAGLGVTTDSRKPLGAAIADLLSTPASADSVPITSTTDWPDRVAMQQSPAAITGANPGKSAKFDSAMAAAATTESLSGRAAAGGLAWPLGLLEVVGSGTVNSSDGVQSAVSALGKQAATPLNGLVAEGQEATAVSPFVASAPAVAGSDQPIEAPDLKTPLGRPGWSEDLGQRLVWMTGNKLQSAELRLNPENLGPVEVRINVSQDQASVQFVAHHAGVREAIEAAIPKLREMLGTQQLTLADVSVTQQSFSEQRDPRGAPFDYDQQAQSGRQTPYRVGDGQEDGITAGQEGEQPLIRRGSHGVLSLYA